MYTVKNYKTKKALIADFKTGVKIETYQPGPYPGMMTGKVALEGPHYPAPHTWYANAEILNGFIIKVK